MDDEYQLRSQIRNCLEESLKVINCGILSSDAVQHPLFKPSITWILIHLYDALRLSERLGERCEIKGAHIQEFSEGDLTALFSAARAAACHVSSARRVTGAPETKGTVFDASWCISMRKGISIQIDDFKVENLFEDDIMLFFGGVKYYVIRNTIEAFEWLRIRYAEDLDPLSTKTGSPVEKDVG